MTSRTTNELERHPYPVRARLLTVVRIEELSPDMRRIVVTGDDLEPTLPCVPLAAGTHVKLVVPDEVTGEVVLPAVGGRGMVRPEGVELVIRDYTVRAVDPVARELSLDFVLHEHGPAGRWAIGATVGDRLGVLGPRGYTVYPATCARYVVGADETALPAAERWIEEAPPGVELDVFVLVEDASRERTLPARPGLRLRWLHRRSGDDLEAAVCDAVPVDDGRTFVWVAAEAASLQQLRRDLHDTAGFDRRSVDVHGYWRREPDGEDPR